MERYRDVDENATIWNKTKCGIVVCILWYCIDSIWIGWMWIVNALATYFMHNIQLLVTQKRLSLSLTACRAFVPCCTVHFVLYTQYKPFERNRNRYEQIYSFLVLISTNFINCVSKSTIQHSHQNVIQRLQQRERYMQLIAFGSSAWHFLCVMSS